MALCSTADFGIELPCYCSVFSPGASGDDQESGYMLRRCPGCSHGAVNRAETRGYINLFILKRSSSKRSISSWSENSGIMSNDTVVSHAKDIVCVMAHSYSPSLNTVRSRIGAFWRGLTAIDVKTFTRIETRADFPRRTYRVGKVNM
jgi:hypothetical protein